MTKKIDVTNAANSLMDGINMASRANATNAEKAEKKAQQLRSVRDQLPPIVRLNKRKRPQNCALSVSKFLLRPKLTSN